MTDSRAVIWHDLECGRYDVDQSLWARLAAGAAGPVLDVGAGTGRVSLALARAGHEVTALDLDAELLAALRERAAGLTVTVVQADGRDFSVPMRYALIIVPMQTIQLMEGTDGRQRFLTRAREHLLPGGVIALAIAEQVESFDVDAGFPEPLPDVGEVDGTIYCSRPTAVRTLTRRRYVLERRREVVDPAGGLTAERDVISLDLLSAEELEADARAVGLTVGPRDEIPGTDDYVPSTVVMLGG